jgi:hypothetical protein
MTKRVVKSNSGFGLSRLWSGGWTGTNAKKTKLVKRGRKTKLKRKAR